jgi:hypothetical protein
MGMGSLQKEINRSLCGEIVAYVCLKENKLLKSPPEKTNEVWGPVVKDFFTKPGAPLGHCQLWTTRQPSLVKAFVFNVLRVENKRYFQALSEHKNPTDVSMRAHELWETKLEYDNQRQKRIQADKDKKEARKRKNEASERDMGLRNEERGVAIPSNVLHKQGDNLHRAAAMLGKKTASPQDGE